MNDISIIINKIKAFFNTAKYVENWYDLLLVHYGLKNGTNIKFRNGLLLENITKNDFIYPSIFIAFGIFIDNGGHIPNNKDNLVTIGYYKFQILNWMSGIPEINEVFVGEEYNKFDFQDKTIIDVGGFIGDTSVFFASKGAKKVYVFEPNKELYNHLLSNVVLNKFENIIKTFNKGVGNKNETIDFFFRDAHGWGSIFDTGMDGKKHKMTIDIVSIIDVLEKTGKIDILKLDCEGSEYPIMECLLNNQLGEKIEEGIMLEAHYIDEKNNPEYAKELVKKLDFKHVTIDYNSVDTAIIWGKKD